MSSLRYAIAKHLLRGSWPKGSELELLSAILCQDDQQAMANWHKWLAQVDIETIDWQDHRMLAAFVGRLRKLEPDYHQLARLEGLAKSHWTNSQLIQRKTLRAVDLLGEQGIPVMLFKGIAFEIGKYSHIPGRFSGDIDVLVPRKSIKRALNLLHEKGWQVEGRSAEQVLTTLSKKLGVNLMHPDGGDFDLHHQPIHAGHITNHSLDLLWQNADRATFLGRDVLIPSLPDLLAISASHGLRFTLRGKKRANLWAIDFINGIEKLNGDFRELAKSAHHLGSSASVCAALTFGLEHFRTRLPEAQVETYLQEQLPKAKLLRFALESQAPNAATKVARSLALGIARRSSRIPTAEFGV